MKQCVMKYIKIKKIPLLRKNLLDITGANCLTFKLENSFNRYIKAIWFLFSRRLLPITETRVPVGTALNSLHF